MTPQQVRITLLGGFDVQVDGTSVPPGVWRLSKARSLVKLLALVEGNSMHRDAVVEALWPDLGPAAATNNLYQAMHSARRALATVHAPPDVLRLRDGVVALCPDGGLETDLQDVAAAFGVAEDPDELLRVAGRCSAGLLPEDRYEDWGRPYQDQVAGMRRIAVLGDDLDRRHVVERAAQSRAIAGTIKHLSGFSG